MTGIIGLPVFITLEGGEGVGKSTQIGRLVARLRQAGIPAMSTREPGGSPRAEEIRGLLLSGAAAALGAEAEAMLFAAARADHLDATIRPALAAGTSVVCDRFFDSTRAYQGALGQVSATLLAALENVAVGTTRPDLTLILDMPSVEGLARAAARRQGTAPPDRFEREGQGFHARLRDAFLAIAAAEPQRCVVIDARPDADTVAGQIWSVVAGRLGLAA